MVWQQEHRLIYEDFLERYRLVVLCLIGFFLLLSGRLFYLQVIKGGFFRNLSEVQRTHIITERAPRGIIYDNKGKVLVGNKTAFVAIFYPFGQNASPSRDMLEQVKRIFPVQDLGASIVKGWRHGQAVRLSNNLTREEMFKLQEQRLVLPGLSVVKESRRDYPSPEANSHLAGYLSEITTSELEDMDHEGYKPGDWIGRGGLEQVYDTYLRGQNGGWEIEVDAKGHQTRLVRYLPPVMGNSLHTTIDAQLQDIASEGLKNSPTGKGAVVAIDVRTGAVRALVSSPGFDPSAAQTKEFSKYLLDKKLPLFNRTIQALYPPGSTFKIITFIAAVTEGGVDPAQTFHCTGKFLFGNKSFACWFHQGHGTLNLIGALANSCNVYFYQLGLQIGPKLIQDYARQFGLGDKTGIELPHEKKGLVPSSEWKQKKMHDVWHPGDTVNIAIGQGPLWVTPLQMCSMVATVANRGTIYQPYIVDNITTPRGEKVFQANPHKKGDVHLPDRAWDLIQRGLEEVVINGTGKGVKFPTLRVAGKTGTAQNPHGQDHAWFVSYAPAENPQLAIAIIVENGGHGGTAAVPIAKKLYEAAFNLVPPEQLKAEQAKEAAPAQDNAADEEEGD